MVGQFIHTIQISAWAHNCGMHVIADYLIEKLQQDDFKAIFMGKAYDALLKTFQTAYHQKALTWDNIQKNTLKADRIDNQIIWGLALRKMLPGVFKEKQEYKSLLFNSFTAALEEFKKPAHGEAYTSYPIITLGNVDYFKRQVLVENASDENHLKYWNETGFEQYGEALLKVLIDKEEEKYYVWLGQEELTLFCEYFGIKSVFLNNTPGAPSNPETLYFNNPTQTHWERQSEKSPFEKPTNDSKPSEFNNEILGEGLELFLNEPKLMGDIYFSDLYLTPKLGMQWLRDTQIEGLGKYFVQNDKLNFIEYLKINKVSETDYANALAFTAGHFPYEDLMLWTKDAELNKKFHVPYSKVLWGALKYDNQITFEKLLTDFPAAYTGAARMPALILAAHYNNDTVAHKLLAHPDFDQDGLISKAVAYVKPAYFHLLNQFDKNNTPALYYAIQNQNILLVKTLLEKGACATYKVNKKIAFEWALDTKNIEMIYLFSETVSEFELLKLYNDEGDNCFHLCLKNRDLVNLEIFGEIYLRGEYTIRREVLAFVNASGQNALHLVAAMGYIEGIEYCLNHDLSLSTPDNQGNIALHFAAANGQFEAVQYLVEKAQEFNKSVYFNFKKYDFNQINHHKQTPLQLADENSHEGIVNYLKTIGCVDLVHDAYAELDKECAKTTPDFEAFCIKFKDIINLKGAQDFTLLHFVCFLKQTGQHTQAILKKLIEHGANLQAKDSEGAAPLHLAAKSNNVEAVRALLSHGAFIDAITYDGRTAIYYAVDTDAKEAFVELKNNQANLELAAFPLAYFGSEPLTLSKLSEMKNGKIAAYLNPYKEQKKDKMVFHSFEQRALYWVENKLGFEQHYPTKLFSELHALEASYTYQCLGMIKIGICVTGAYMLGPYAGGVELVKQSFLYASPTMKQKAGQLYYYIKPGIHNYNLPYVSSAFDHVAQGVSLTHDGLFKIFNYTDLFNNFGRRVVGGVAGVGGLKVVQKLGVEKEGQALTLFLAREAGYFVVDAYHAASPQRLAQKKVAQYTVDPALNQAYEVWGAILGKEKAEKMIHVAHIVSESKAYLYQYVGEAERARLGYIIDGFTPFQDYICNLGALIAETTPYHYLSIPPKVIKNKVQLSLEQWSECQDRFLIGLEEFIHTHGIPESEYQHVMLRYAHLQKELLCRNLKQTAEAHLKQAIMAENEEEITYYEEKIKAYKEEVSNSEKCANEHYEKMPKGKIANAYNAAQAKSFEAWSDKRDLETLKQINLEICIEEAYEALGDKLSPETLYQYLATTLNTYVNLTSKDLESFKSNFEPEKMQAPDFKEKLKPLWATFASEKIDDHIASKLESTSKAIEDLPNTELENLINEFKILASPEELRVLELNQNEEIKIAKYQLFSDQKSVYIKERALTQAKYAYFINAADEYDQAESNLMFAQLDLEHMEAESLKIENYLKNQSTLSEAEKRKWIIVNNEKVDDAKLKVEQKTEILTNKKNLLDQAEVKTLTKFDATEKYHFKAFSVNYKENIDTSNKYFQAEMQKTMYEEQHQYEEDKKQDALEGIDKKTVQVESLNSFIFDYKSLYKIARQGVEHGFGRGIADIKIDLLDSLEKILPFDRAFLEKHFNIILPNYITTGKRAKWAKEDITNNLLEKCNKLKTTQLPKLNGEIESLKNIITDSDNNLKILGQKIKNVSEKLNVLEAKYLEKLSPEQKISFQERKTTTTTNKPNNASQDWTKAAAIIDPIIAYGFANFKDKDELSKYFSDQIIYSKYDFRPEPKTKAELAAERELLIQELFVDELSGFTRNQKRTENRVYDYYYAKVTRTEKKRHRHRGERILKPFANEIMGELSNGACKPFKNFHGGEDKKGQTGLQLTWRTDNTFSLDIHKNNVPIYNIYESEKPKPPIPEFSQPSHAITSSTLSKKAENLEEYMSDLPSEKSDGFTSSNVLTPDSPFAQAYFAEQLNDVLSRVDNLGKSPEKSQDIPITPKPVKPSSSQKVQIEKKVKPVSQVERPSSSKIDFQVQDIRDAEPVIFSKMQKPSNNWWKMAYRSFNGENSTEIDAWKKNNTEATPKWLVQLTLDMKEVSYPVEQLPRIVVEALGETAKALLEDNFSLDNFFKAQSFDELIAEEKLRQQSYFMMAKFLGDDVAKILAKEKPESLKHTEKFISNFYHASQEDKLKGLVKIGIAACAYNFLKLRNPRLVSSAFSHISKTENNAAPLALQGPPKTFLPNYSYRPTPAVLLRHDQRINTTYLGEYNPHEVLENQGTIPDDNIKTFMGSTFKSYRLEQDIVLSRVGNSFEPYGQYFSFSKANGALSDRIDRGIVPIWVGAKGPNIVDTAYYFNIPRGTTIHVGLAAPQGGIYLGGTEQIFISEPWSIPGVSVVFRHPIKEAHLWNSKVPK